MDTDVAGVPLIFGGELPLAERTVIENAARLVVLLPSLTAMTMLLNVPTLLDDGVPLKRPVDVLKLAQLGRF